MGFVLVWAGIALLVVWVAWNVISKTTIGASWSHTTAGKAVDKAIDVSQAIAAYGSLTGIRYLECVENDPKAIDACDYLRSVVTAWVKPEAKVTPATDPAALVHEVVQ